MTANAKGHPHLVVSGAAGFLGRAVVARARALGLRVTPLTRADVDQRDPVALAEALRAAAPDMAIDAAGLLPGKAAVHEMAQNVDLTRGWLGALDRLDRPLRLVLAGSAAVYGSGAARSRATRETDPMQPTSDYGRSKLEALILAHEAQAKRGFDLQTGILFNLVGAGQSGSLVPQAFINRALAAAGGRYVVGPTGDIRDFVDVQDAADALITMARRGLAGSVLNVATGIPTRIADLLALLRLMLGGEWASLPDATGPRPDHICYGDPERLCDMTGWHPRSDLRTALKRAIEATRAADSAANPKELS